ncbi:MAG: S-adenosylmethionine:tRNA ribosyltransferase-isomerase [Rikenellaceae bacterium]
MTDYINIKDFNYNLPDEKIAKYPLGKRSDSKLLFWDGNKIEDSHFVDLKKHLPENSTLIFNNTKVIRARMLFFKETGAKIEIFCLEPHNPRSYEEALASKDGCEWYCMIGNLKKWKDGMLKTKFSHNDKDYEICVEQVKTEIHEKIVRFTWNDQTISFGELLEMLGSIPIPPYLNRKSESSDLVRYQTVYSSVEGSVAAPTAGLHFTQEIISDLNDRGITTQEVTLHVGAGTFLPVKAENVRDHAMHIEYFSVSYTTLREILKNIDNVIAVGTTSVRTLESLSVLGYRVLKGENLDKTVGQWEAYDIPCEVSGKELISALLNYMEQSKLDVLYGSTQIMITKGYVFRIISGLVTNFHQPQSTLLLLINAVVGDKWHEIYNFALNNNYRFLSYGDSSLLLLNKGEF